MELWKILDVRRVTWKEIDDLVNNRQFMKNRWEVVSKFLKEEINKN